MRECLQQIGPNPSLILGGETFTIEHVIRAENTCIEVTVLPAISAKTSLTPVRDMEKGVLYIFPEPPKISQAITRVPLGSEHLNTPDGVVAAMDDAFSALNEFALATCPAWGSPVRLRLPPPPSHRWASLLPDESKVEEDDTSIIYLPWTIDLKNAMRARHFLCNGGNTVLVLTPAEFIAAWAAKMVPLFSMHNIITWRRRRDNYAVATPTMHPYKAMCMSTSPSKFEFRMAEKLRVSIRPYQQLRVHVPDCNLTFTVFAKTSRGNIQGLFGPSLRLKHDLYTRHMSCTITAQDNGMVIASPNLAAALGMGKQTRTYIGHGQTVVLPLPVSALPPRTWTMSVPRLEISEVVRGKTQYVDSRVSSYRMLHDEIDDADDTHVTMTLEGGCGMASSSIWLNIVTNTCIPGKSKK